MVGKLRAATFPQIFGPGRDQPLDEEAVRAAFAALAAEIGDGRTPEEVADGFIRIAVENMANAIKKISVQRGYDVTEYALNCFGAAGGQHACLVADTLGMETVLIHPLSGLLSAYTASGWPRSAPAASNPSRRRSASARSKTSKHCAHGSLRQRRPRSRAKAWSPPRSPYPCGRTCATTAPTRRCPCHSAKPRPCATPSKACICSASALSRRRSAWSSPRWRWRRQAAARRVPLRAPPLWGGLGRGDTDGTTSPPRTPPTSCRRRAFGTMGRGNPSNSRPAPASTLAGRGTRRRCACATRCVQALASPGPRSSSSRTRPSWSSPAGAWRSRRATTWCFAAPLPRHASGSARPPTR